MNKITEIFVKNPLLFLWPLCIIKKELVLILSFAYLIMFYFHRGIKLTRYSKVLLSIGAIQCLAIVFAMLINSFELNRIFAALNTTLIWINAGMILSIYTKYNVGISIKNCGIMAIINISILFIVTIFGIFLHFKGMNISIPGGRQLLNDDYINGQLTYRTCCFFEYPTLISMFCFVNIPFAIKFLDSKKFKYLTIGFLFIACMISIYMSRSRWGLLLCLFLFAVFVFLKELRKGKDVKSYIIFSVFLVGILVSPAIFTILMKLLNSRSGSNSMRFIIYYESVKSSISNNFLIGCGVKNMIGGYPLGSHSSIIGSFYKTGLIGFALFMYLYIMILFKSIKDINHHIILSASILSILCFMIFEDIDGTNWLWIYFALLISFIICRKKKHGVDTCEKKIEEDTICDAEMGKELPL